MPVLDIGRNAFNNVKKVVEGVGILNEVNVTLMSLLDVQAKNVFEILLYDKNISFDPIDIAYAALDTVMARLHIQTLQLNFPRVEYENLNEQRYVKDIVHPEDCTITFIENEIGLVRTYMNHWCHKIAYPDLDGGYFFRDDQDSAEKEAIIILQMGTGIPGFGWVKLTGLRPIQQGALTIGHGERDPMTLDWTFAVNNCYYYMTPF